MSKAFPWACGKSGAHFSLALPAILLSLTAKPGPSASEVLRKAFDSHLKQRVEMVQVTATPSDPGSKVYKLFVDKGWVHVNILAPIVMTNTRSVDNGKELQIYYPTQKEKVIQPSPQKFRVPTDKRMKLVERNFTLSIKDEGTTVAERPVYLVFLKSKNRVGDRVLSIDKEKFTVLRSILKDGAKSFVLLETIVANFKAPRKDDEFKLPSSSEVQIVRKWGPVELAKFRNASQALGFEPRIPTTIPYGFEITHKQVVGQEKKPILACRLSDGMNTITVFEWSPKVFGGESPFQNVKTVADVYGIRYYAEGDAPQAVLTEVRNTFKLGTGN